MCFFIYAAFLMIASKSENKLCFHFKRKTENIRVINIMPLYIIMDKPLHLIIYIILILYFYFSSETHLTLYFRYVIIIVFQNL